jgi:hypothetical protein
MGSWASGPAPCPTPTFARTETKLNSKRVAGWGRGRARRSGYLVTLGTTFFSLPTPRRTQTKDTDCWTSSSGLPSLCSRDKSASFPRCTSHGYRTHEIWTTSVKGSSGKPRWHFRPGDRKMLVSQPWRKVQTLASLLSFFFFFLVCFLVGLGFELSFALPKQALYCLSNTSSQSCSGYFGDRVLQTIYQDQSWTIILLNSTSQVARIIGVSYWCPALTSLLLLFFFCRTGVWTQDLHLEPLRQPFFVLGIFSR